MKKQQPLDHQLQLCVLPLEGGVLISFVDATAGERKALLSAFGHGSSQDIDFLNENLSHVRVDLLCNHI